MTPDLPPLKPLHALLVLLSAALLLALQLIPDVPELLRFSRPAFDAGKGWQLLSAQFVHLSLGHAALNAAALAVSLLAWRVWVALPAQCVALAGGALGVALVLVLDGDCLFYAGLSGALHGLWAGNAVYLMQTRSPQGGLVTCSTAGSLPGRRVMAAGVLLALVGKLLLQGADAASAFDAWLQIPVYRPAHWAGLGGGLVAVSLVLMLGHEPATARGQGQ